VTLFKGAAMGSVGYARNFKKKGREALPATLRSFQEGCRKMLRR